VLLPLSYADSTESPNALLDWIDALVLGGLLLSMQSSSPDQALERRSYASSSAVRAAVASAH
jgi:hypothetical protein